MSIILTSPFIILLMQILTLAGFLILTVYTIISYLRLKNRTLLFISLAFASLTITIILEIILYISMIENEYIETIFESIQFIAAFFFFTGLRIIKRKVNGEDNK